MINAFLRKVYFNIIYATVPSLRRRVGDQILWPFLYKYRYKCFSSSPPKLNKSQSAFSVLSKWYRTLFLRGKVYRRVRLSSHFRKVSRSEMRIVLTEYDLKTSPSGKRPNTQLNQYFPWSNTVLSSYTRDAFTLHHKRKFWIFALVRRCVIEDENDRVNDALMMRCCCVHAGIQEIFDGSGLPSKPRARNTTRRNDCRAGQEELDRSEHPSAEYTRVYWGQPPLAHTPNFYKVQDRVRTWPSSFKLGISKTEMSAQGLKLFSFLSALPGKFWGGT